MVNTHYLMGTSGITVEEFHKTWKSTCRIEDTQLRDPDRIVE